MKFGSVCSGIEAASVAWSPLGWSASWFAEIEPFPSAVLAHHHPEVPNLGDMTQIPALLALGAIDVPDVLCGGTPCQAFSVAGLRKSLDDARGNLSLTFCTIADAIDEQRRAAGDEPCIVFWENVPGVLNTKDNAFGCFLAGLAGEADPLEPPGGKWSNAGAVLGPQRAVAWRVLDAQYFGVAQRRRRVFVVASARNGFDPAAVLFELDGVRRDSAPSREAREEIAPCVTAGAANGGAAHGARSGSAKDNLIVPVQAFGGNRTSGSIEVAPAPLAQPGSGYKGDFESETFLVQSTGAYRCAGCDRLIDPAWGWGKWCDYCGHEHGSSLVQETAHTLRGEGFDASEDGTGRGTPLVPVVAGTLRARHNMNTTEDAMGGGLLPVCNQRAVVAFDTTQVTSATNRSNPQPGDPCHPLAAGAHPPAIAFDCKASGMAGFGVGDIASTMRAMGHAGSHSNGGGQLAVAVALRGREGGATAELGDEVQNCLRASSGGGDKPHVLTAMQVRRLTPTECERLQGFPDGWTQIPWRNKPASECPDGPRYKALGNSWAVPVVRWIGMRIAQHLLV